MSMVSQSCWYSSRLQSYCLFFFYSKLVFDPLPGCKNLNSPNYITANCQSPLHTASHDTRKPGYEKLDFSNVHAKSETWIPPNVLTHNQQSVIVYYQLIVETNILSCGNLTSVRDIVGYNTVTHASIVDRKSQLAKRKWASVNGNRKGS